MLFFRNSVFFLLLAIITNTIQAKPFTYAYKTEVNSNNEQVFELPPQLEQLAKVCYPHLNNSLFFNTKFIQNPKEVRQWHRDRLGAQFFSVTTQDDVIIHCTFFDRNSDHAILIGPGFTNNREIMSPLLAMFDHSDVVMFDFRGHGYDEDHPPSFWKSSISQYFFEADARVATIAKKEELDVLAVAKRVRQLKNNPNYKLYGVGVCYGALVFLKTAANFPHVFDKLVLDGCWLSLNSFIEKLKKDPRLICVPQEGGLKDNFIFKRKITQSALEFTATNILGFDLSDISLANIIEKNKKNLQKIPIMFFHGKDDLMVLRDEFELFWNALPTPNKVAIITSNPHVRNHFKQKELYALLCKLFFELPHQDFIQAVMRPSVASHHIVKNMQSQLTPFFTTMKHLDQWSTI